MKQTIKTFLLGVLCIATCYVLSSCNNTSGSFHPATTLQVPVTVTPTARRSTTMRITTMRDMITHTRVTATRVTTTTPMKGTGTRATTTAIRMREATPAPMR